MSVREPTGKFGSRQPRKPPEPGNQREQRCSRTVCSGETGDSDRRPQMKGVFGARISAKRAFTKLHSVDSSPDHPPPTPKLQTQLEKPNDKVGSPAGLGPVSLQTFLQFHCETSPLRRRDGAENRSYLLAPRCHRRRSEQSKSGETRRCSSCGCFSPL